MTKASDGVAESWAKPGANLRSKRQSKVGNYLFSDIK